MLFQASKINFHAEIHRCRYLIGGFSMLLLLLQLAQLLRSLDRLLGESELISVRSVLACWIFGWSAVAAAQIVECIDANGNKVFAQTCPNGTVKRRDIEERSLPGSVKSAPADDAPKQSLKDQEKAFEQRRDERLKAGVEAAKNEEKARQARQACAEDRRRLDLLEAGRRFKRVDPDTGEHVSMDENRRQDEISALTAEIQSLGEACR